jgi:hypothetical protein
MRPPWLEQWYGVSDGPFFLLSAIHRVLRERKRMALAEGAEGGICQALRAGVKEQGCILLIFSQRSTAISAREKEWLSQWALRYAEGGFVEHFVLWEKEQEWILLFFSQRYSAISAISARGKERVALAGGAEGR